MQFMATVCHYLLFSSPAWAKNQSVCLYLTTPHDPNNDRTGLLNRINKCMGKYLLFSKLYACAIGYKIVHQRVSCIADIDRVINQLASNGNKIQSLWILAHGSYQEIALVHEDINAKTLPKLQNSFQKLDAHATIILAACHAGYQGVKLPVREKPIAAYFAAMAPGRKVYAPKEVLYDAEIYVGKNSSNVLKGVFFTPWTHENFTTKFLEKPN